MTLEEEKIIILSYPGDYEMINSRLKGGWVIATRFNRVTHTSGIEETVFILEKPEPEQTEKIVGVKSVALNEVDDYLKLGYVVHELYAKTATLTLKETVKR